MAIYNLAWGTELLFKDFSETGLLPCGKEESSVADTTTVWIHRGDCGSGEFRYAPAVLWDAVILGSYVVKFWID
ncbi:hypothetical protein H106_05077 [Trichophyton rubrum CBS 735.88]|nr:hypothetical protein H106_05077 [Trichophyton rubrum CBS 735.88]